MRFLKTAPLVAALAIASACTPDVMMMTSPNAAIDMMPTAYNDHYVKF